MPQHPPEDGDAGDGDGVPADAWQERLALLAAPPRIEPARLAVGAAVVVVVLALAAVVATRSEPPPPELDLPVATAATDATVGGTDGSAAVASTTTSSVPDVVVHAAGAVSTPGVYTLPPGSRVADLVEAAGGAAPGADLGRVNLAAALVDGERVYLPATGEDVPVVEGSAAAPTASAEVEGEGGGGVVDLNRADAAELETLPGVGPATAAAIVEERDRRGRFSSVDDLLDVRGIGEAKLAAVRDRVTVS